MARRRRKEDPEFGTQAGPAVGSGAQHVEGPARFEHIAIFIFIIIIISFVTASSTTLIS